MSIGINIDDSGMDTYNGSWKQAYDGLRKDIKNKYVEKDAVIQMIKNEKTYGSFEDARPKIIVASILDKLSTM